MDRLRGNEENLRVITRIRPRLRKRELRKPSAIHIIDEETVQVRTEKTKGHVYSSHAAFDGRTNNEAFFNASGVKSLVVSSLSGYR